MEFINNIKDSIKDAATEAKQEFIDSLTEETADTEGKKGKMVKIATVTGATLITAGLSYFAWEHFKIGEKIQDRTIKKIEEKLDKLGYTIVKKEETPAEKPTEETK